MFSDERAAPTVDDPRWSHHYATLAGVRLHYVEAGSGPLVLLLHGFPELWYGWRRQLLPLAAAGFRVVAPDLRGYNLSDKPAGVAAYGLAPVSDDVAALILALGERRASVIGHDFGAAVAWAFATRHATLLDRLCVLNGPHPARFASGLGPRQLLRSWYILFFQLPRAPEWALSRRGHAALLSTFDELAPHARLTPAERAAYLAAFEQPGALRAAINYYRAIFRPGVALRPRPIDADVLVLWGERDPHLGAELADPGRWAPRARVERFPHAGHFLQHEQASAVNARLIELLRGGLSGE